MPAVPVRTICAPDALFPSGFTRRPVARAVALMLSLAVAAPLAAAEQEQAEEPAAEASLGTIRVTAEEIARQALGSSTITASDIEARPPANDISELLRTMPGVNLTGNSSSGQYGNNRQIDLRGMGPENTLILIDGRPVNSRDSVRMGRSGERNTRGDTNWVPTEAIERIEVLRGPAAARYGSGASGGVVNIITRAPGDELHGSVTVHGVEPQHSEEGGTQRVGFNLSGPVAGDLSFRLYGGLAKTEADSLELNEQYATGVTPPAGREGVRNRDLNALLRWDVREGQAFELEGGYSRQGSIYAGDRAVSGTGSDLLTELAERGAETNTMTRRSAALSHRGTWAFGSTRVTASYDETDNTRLNEGLAGGVEGSISTDATYSTSELRNARLSGEIDFVVTRGRVEHVVTLGVEHRDLRLDDPYSMSQSATSGGGIADLPLGERSSKSDQQITGLYVEDNIYVGAFTLTPGLRFDHHSEFGGNWSPSLNAQYQITDDVRIKGGVARAFKAPNLYQANPNYLYYTMGNGCPVDYPSLGAGCYVQGNDQLDPETSINKEIGIEWAPPSGHLASLTYFHNDYDDKIVAGLEPVGLTANTLGRIFQWTNATDALVQGLEGAFNLALLGDAGSVLMWNNNLTYMIDNKDKATDQPLSVIPEYTLNSWLDWRPTDRLSAMLTATVYGKQESATLSSTSGAAIPGDTRGSYALWGLSGRYRFAAGITIGAGVNNLLDRRLFRESTNNTGGAAGAATYNEPGRSYYLNVSAAF